MTATGMAARRTAYEEGSWFQSMAESMGRWDAVWSRPWDEIAGLEVIPGSLIDDNEWIIPAHWASPRNKSLSSRRVDFRTAVPPDWDDTDIRSIAAKRRAKRIAILLATKPLKIGRQLRQPNRPSTWVILVRCLLSAVRSALQETDRGEDRASTCPDDEVTIFATLSTAAIERLRAEQRTLTHLVVPKLNSLRFDGSFDDWPSDAVSGLVYDSDPYRPFTDDFTAEIARAALWFIEVLGPDILTCVREGNAISQTPSGSKAKKRVAVFKSQWLASWSGIISKPCFALEYGVSLPHQGFGSTGAPYEHMTSWPPSRQSSLKIMISLLQTAHMIVMFLSTGARDGELIDLDIDCLTPLTHGYGVVGKTYKLADSPQGEDRYWPLPEIAVVTVRQQQRLQAIIASAPKKLWCAFSPCKTDGQKGPSAAALKYFARAVLLPDGRSLNALCDGNVHPHRFRKTVVRLAALSVVGANQILVDVLGHRDPEMTLGYILSDPNFQADLDQVRREASYALAKDAVAHADLNGGPAATAVRSLARRMLADRASPDQESMGLERAAVILSENGQVALVRKGVLCTKTFQQAGPCTRQAGSPDIGRCQVDCLHRLELEAARADHRASVEQILKAMPREQGLERTFWQGQLLAHLSPFADLRAEMLQRPLVQAALEGLARETVGDVEPEFGHSC